MQHYWGAKAIAARVGIHPRTIYSHKRLYGLPGFLRIDKRCHFRRVMYASEAMIVAWELAMSRDYDERLRANHPGPDAQRVKRPSSMQIHRRMTQIVDEMAAEDTKGDPSAA